MLENFFLEFTGCLLIVSHDRYFMDRLVDHLFVFEGEGEIRDFPGNYTQYREWQKAQEYEEAEIRVKTKAEEKEEQPKPAAKKKLSFKEQREFESLEKEIPRLEKERAELTEKLSDASLPFEKLQQFSERINEINSLIDEKEMRWLELSEFVEG